MMLLYNGLDRLLAGVDKMKDRLVDFPVISEMKTTMIYLGILTDLAEVEVKKNKTEKGWLYNTNSIVFFRYKEDLYELWVSKLKDLAEEKFASKKIIKDDEEASAGVMRLHPDRAITGFIAVDDLLAVSNKVSDSLIFKE